MGWTELLMNSKKNRQGSLKYLIQSLEGRETTVELRYECSVSGMIAHVDDYMKWAGVEYGISVFSRVMHLQHWDDWSHMSFNNTCKVPYDDFVPTISSISS